MSEVIRGATDWIAADWNSVHSVLRGLLMPFASTTVGAFVGARFAFKLRAKEDIYKSRKETLRKLSAAVGRCGAITNACIGTRFHLIRPCVSDFRQSRSSLLAARNGQIHSQIVKLELNLTHLMPPQIPVDELVVLVQEIDSRSGSEFFLAQALQEAVGNLIETIAHRNKWISDSRVSDRLSSEEGTLFYYFGIQNSKGDIDNSYVSMIDGMDDSADDTIFLSHELFKKLSEILIHLADKFARDYREPYHYILADFSDVQDRMRVKFRPRYKNWLSESKSIRRKWWQTRATNRANQLRVVNSVQTVEVPKGLADQA